MNDESIHDKFVCWERGFRAKGLDPRNASGLAGFELRVDSWPTGWGDNFEAIIFGDFDPPDKELVFNDLGITIQPEKLTNTVVGSGLTVLRARVIVSDKSRAAVKDAAARLNLLVGVLSVTNLGAPIRWWSYVTSESRGGEIFRLGDRRPDDVLTRIQRLPAKARTNVIAALYWIREPRRMFREHTRSDQLAVYAGYWNAFECLVGATNHLQPGTRATPAEKKAIIHERLAALGVSVGPAEIAALYREVVDPGLRNKAEHAIHECLGADAEHFIKQCFDHDPSDQALYKLRNAIDHGTIDVNDPETMIMVSARFGELQTLVFRMLWGVLRLNSTAPPE